jgi:Putative Actinobacterial Holin-X, holin superfamily III
VTERAATTLESPDRSVGDVLTDIVGGVERLVRAEVRLATTGALSRVKAAALGGALVVVGAMLWLMTTGLILWGAVARLSETMRPWQAMLVVAGVTGLVATAVLAVGVKGLHIRREP